MSIITLDGVPLQLRSPDLDGDGKTGGVETIQTYQGITPVSNPTELGESLRESFEDHIDPVTKMSSIDMKTRIYNVFERNAMMAIDSSVSLGMLPVRCLVITRQAKRLNVSMKGEGRKEIVDLVAGKREHDKQVASGGLFGGIKNMMGGNKT